MSYFTPGPGSYETVRIFGNEGPKFSFKAKIKLSKHCDSPPPNAYNPSPVINTAFKNISFGVGDRNFLRKLMSDSPGPGTYEIKSEFSKTGKV